MDIKKDESWARSVFVDNDEFLKTILAIPRKILDNHEVDGLAQMVLHELGQEKNLDLKRAYFMVSSPDFNHVRGVAGFCSQESSDSCQVMWQDPNLFHQKIQTSAFHENMKKFLQKEDFHRDGVVQSSKYIDDIKAILNIESPSVYTWNLRNNNKGILIFEESQKRLCTCHPEVLEHVTALLGLCPL
ncbi:MAG: hypothetical protein ABH827_02885 [bacterium]